MQYHRPSTFHYGSIKIDLASNMGEAMTNLHSTMVLLKLSIFSFSSLEIAISTFHYGSIKINI